MLPNEAMEESENGSRSTAVENSSSSGRAAAAAASEPLEAAVSRLAIDSLEDTPEAAKLRYIIHQINHWHYNMEDMEDSVNWDVARLVLVVKGIQTSALAFLWASSFFFKKISI